MTTDAREDLERAKTAITGLRDNGFRGPAEIVEILVRRVEGAEKAITAYAKELNVLDNQVSVMAAITALKKRVENAEAEVHELTHSPAYAEKVDHRKIAALKSELIANAKEWGQEAAELKAELAEYQQIARDLDDSLADESVDRVKTLGGLQRAVERIKALKAENAAKDVTIWQLKGALGYHVPGEIPCGDFHCGLCDAKEKQISAQAKALEEARKIADEMAADGDSYVGAYAKPLQDALRRLPPAQTERKEAVKQPEPICEHCHGEQMVPMCPLCWARVTLGKKGSNPAAEGDEKIRGGGK